MQKSAVLLVNLGSPDSTSVSDVRSYLREFLSDDRVLDAAKPIQQFVLNCFILPTRPKRSAEAYKKVWTDHGSPLIVTSKNVQALLQERIDDHVELAMRYGGPSIPSAISNLKAKGINKLLLVPLYPHYAMSSYETVVVRVMEEIAEQIPDIEVETVQPFYNDPDYIEALYQSAKPYLETEFDHLLFSYHGIPARHLSKADSSKGHCRIVKDCCSTCSPAHATCYKAQTLATTNAFVARAGLTPEQYSVSFQSRLGREPWLEPYTDFIIPQLVKTGKKRILVMTPAFVSDCLETLEEIAMEGKEQFLEAGGESFIAIPCLNDHPAWIDFLAKRARASSTE
ncbi:ferrochelatase [Candidatus Pelagisphaera phototrophica]|uniref:ferrochelatase n=1 Tax=Candidatus Pelagisphaera phototrophica TaxID=2684113 RepID=UPI0019DB57CE|nr:ferrochelatase [Candidatus Pelagisphaera phototrophica]QXD31467.1 ferrochelatase [Candidatus Pelagisphaera phototrophica]